MTGLTPSQLSDLETLKNAVDADPSSQSARAAYYDYLTSTGDPYGNLASLVQDPSTLDGSIACGFFRDTVHTYHGKRFQIMIWTDGVLGRG